VRAAAASGAQVVLLPELFETPYFPAEEREEHFALARPLEGHPTIGKLAALAAELEVVLPVSFFERAANAYFNSLAMIDADGSVLGVYRKSHIPDGPGYEEKYYFSPGDTGFRVFRTRYGNVGAAVCWDQWFPECARAMALQDAEVLLYPTAIGDEPQTRNPGQPHYQHAIETKAQWQRVMQGHAAANLIPVVASNRIGTEESAAKLTFYGASFITDASGEIVAEAPTDEEAVLTHKFDLDALRASRAGWGLFRDRRTDLYGGLLSLDGSPRQS